MAQEPRTLFDGLVQLRDSERERIKKSTRIIHGDQVPREVTPMGILRWYTHPLLDEPAIKNLIYCLQEIPSGSRSGRVKHQGGRIHYVWKGRGYTIVDGVSHEWEEGDLICIPIKPDGVEYQHFNSGDELALLMMVEPNLVHSLGVDLGSVFEVIEPAPEYRQSR